MLHNLDKKITLNAKVYIDKIRYRKTLTDYDK